MKQKLGVVFVTLVVSTFALAACSGSDSGGYSPPEMPMGGDPAAQSQSAGGVVPGEPPTGPQGSSQPDTAPQQEGEPVQEGEPPGDSVPPGEPAPGDNGAPKSGVPLGVAPPPKKAAAAAKMATPLRCTAQALPGTYTVIVAQGRVAGTTFTATTGSASAWQRLQYTAAKPSPKAKAAPASPATQKHASQPLYVYSGTYTVYDAKSNVDTVGCASLVTTQSGVAIKGTKFSARNANNPLLAKAAHSTLVASGPVTRLTIAHLSQTGGTGTFVLSNKFTGTIQLTSRSTVP